MFKTNVTACLLLSAFMTPTYSGVMKTIEASPLIILSGGPAWQSSGKTQTLTLQPNVLNTYVANKNNSSLGSGALFLGMQRALYKSVLGAVGVAFTGSGTAKLSGDVWQDAEPNFNNFSYAYKANQLRVGLKARVVETEPLFINLIKPYLTGEVAAGFNRSYGYTLTRTIDTAVLQPPFTSNTVTALTYAFGAGLQGEVTPHIQVGVGYEFSDWGKNNLGAANGQTTGNRLGTNHLYVNELQFSVLYTI